MPAKNKPSMLFIAVLLISPIILFTAISSSTFNEKVIVSGIFILVGAVHLYFRSAFASMAVEYQRKYPLDITRHLGNYDSALRYTIIGATLLMMTGIVALIQAVWSYR